MRWWPVLVASAGCYLLKAAGTLVPDRLVRHPLVRDALALLPVALIVALVAVNTVDGGGRLVLDARLAGLAVALVAVVRKTPFLAVVMLAGATTALVRAVQ